MLSQYVNYMGLYLDKGQAPDYRLLVMDFYFQQLKMLITNVFKWEGLPDSCNADYLELSEFQNGQAIFFDEPTMGFLTLDCVDGDLVNVYGEPLNYIAGGNDYYTAEVSAKDCVIIKNNNLKRPTIILAELFASKLANIDLSQTINLNANKTPYMIACTEKERLSMTQLYTQQKGNAPLIVVNEGMDFDKFKVLKTDAPYLVNKLQDHKNQVMAELLSWIGLNNANTDKKERLITDEVNANNEFIELNKNSMLGQRQEACRRINEKFGLNVSVKINMEVVEKWRNTQQSLEPLSIQE